MATTTEPITAPNIAATEGTKGENTQLSTEYDTPLGLAHTTMAALKDRIKLHYDLASDYYLNLWYVSILFPVPSNVPADIHATGEAIRTSRVSTLP